MPRRGQEGAEEAQADVQMDEDDNEVSMGLDGYGCCCLQVWCSDFAVMQ